jgi:serine/threonine-protein kinase
MEYIQKHVMEPPIPLNERVAGKTFPVGLGEVVAKALAKKPEDRFQSASEFALALAPFGEPGSERALPVSLAAPSTLEASPVSNPNANTLRAPQRSGPGAGLLIGVAAACLLLGVVLAVVAMKLLVR